MFTSNFPEPVYRICQAVNSAGGRAMLVGGTVRDMLLGIPPKDFDIEVSWIYPEHLEEIVKSLDPDSFGARGKQFEVMNARFGEWSVDISIPRWDSKCAPGHKGFVISGDPFMSMEDAARRRDFTVNSMGFNPLNGELADFFGGRKDLNEKILRATDTVLFRDDPLRVLRAMQFAGRFGFSVEPETMAVCIYMTGQNEFAELPSARIGEEWRKLLLQSPRPSVGLEVGLATGAFHVLHPELVKLVGCPQNPVWHPEGSVWNHTLMTTDEAAELVRFYRLTGDPALVGMVSALGHDLGKPATTKFEDGRWKSKGHDSAGIMPARDFLSRMQFGNDVNERVQALIREHLAPVNIAQVPHRAGRESAVRKLANRLAPATIDQLALVSEADQRGRAVTLDKVDGVDEMLEIAEKFNITDGKPFKILTGRHLIDRLGWEPYPKGVRFQPILETVFQAQLDGQITTVDEGLEMAEQLRRNMEDGED